MYKDPLKKKVFISGLFGLCCKEEKVRHVSSGKNEKSPEFHLGFMRPAAHFVLVVYGCQIREREYGDKLGERLNLHPAKWEP